MNFSLKEHKNDLLFLPLGGAGEIGMNLNMYHLDGKWIIVDCGSGFAEDYLPGIDIIVPDISFIIKHKKDILGIVLTHAHEDHLGALPYLWNEIGCPIYATTFTAAFLKEKLKEAKYEKMPAKINYLKTGENIKLGEFDINLVPLCHSTPEMQALVIKTKYGNIFHTGDWKFDEQPVIGDTNDEQLIAEYGKQGVLALVGDSTNVFNEEYSGSESSLHEPLLALAKKCQHMLVVTTFASNVARLHTLIEIGRKVGRKVVLIGRSFKRIIIAAEAAGYLQNMEDCVIDEESIPSFSRKELMIVATGCQGEPLAAVTKMAGSTHHSIKLKPNDMVIFSSKIIPGNDKKLFRVFNNLVRLGVEVITEKTHDIHVSGHPSKKELKRLYSLLKPQILIPVHGEHVHMYEHKKLGDEMGIKQTVLVENGDVVRLTKNNADIVGKVEAKELGIYGNFLLSGNSPILRMRRKIREDGVFMAVVMLSNKGRLACDPVLFAPGYLDQTEDIHLFNYLKDEIVLLISEHDTNNKKLTFVVESLTKEVRSKIKAVLNTEVGRIPVIQVEIRIL